MIRNRVLWTLRGLVGVFCVSLSASTGFAADALVDDQSRDEARRLAETGVRFDMDGITDYARFAWLAALRTDPNCELARWRLGYVKIDEQWVPMAKSPSDCRDARIEAYRYHRAHRDRSVQSELALARWCRSHAMIDRAEVHFRNVIDNPVASASERAAAIRELGLRQFGGQWMTNAQIRDMQEVMLRGRQDLQFWTDKLAKSIRQLRKGRRQVRQEAIEKLRTIDDPTAIPALELHISSISQPLAIEAVGIIAAIQHPQAAESLVRHAVASPWDPVRQEATVQLKRRPLHDVVPTLLASLQTPIRSVFQITAGPDGQIVHEHMFFQEGADENLQLRLTNRAVPNGLIPVDTAAELNRIRNRAAQIQNDVQRRNQTFEQQNQRIYDVLRETTGEQHASNPVTWWNWWKQYNEYEVADIKPTRSLAQSSTYAYVPSTFVRSHECFPAGTLVWTELGTVAIESIQAGDRVLSQDPESGELAYRVVTATTRRERAPMQEVTLGDQRLVLTTGHPLWVQGKGWRMAKRLKLGDSIHALDGSRRVTRLELTGEGVAHNLVVDGFGCYFVAKIGILAHDNTYRTPTRALSPGLLAKK